MNKLSKAISARHVVGIAVTLLCLAIIARQINLAEVVAALEKFHWPYLALGITALALGYALRILRWCLMLRASGASVTWRDCSAPFLGSIALNNVLPLRAGDVVRAFVFPSAMGISKTMATSSLLMERLLDLMTLLLCLALGMLAIPQASLPGYLVDGALALTFLGGLTTMAAMFFSGSFSKMLLRFAHAEGYVSTGRRHRSLVALGNLFHDIEAMSRPKILVTVIAISMLVWAGESGLFYFMLLGFGLDASPGLAVVIMTIATLSTLVPSSPGYIGPFHLAAFTAITLFGGTSAQAGSYAVLTHLALWVPTTAAGAVAILMKPALFPAVRMGLSKP